jgi:hypothetical protein
MDAQNHASIVAIFCVFAITKSGKSQNWTDRKIGYG